ncbi:MarR family transcriptional regulator, partial [Pantoea endophytica]
MTDLNLVSNTPRRARQGNELVALRALQRFGALSRAELARKMGLNRSSSGHILAELINSGLVREVSEDLKNTSAGVSRGRPGILLELVPEAAYFLGIEIGVEHITTTLIDLTAAITEIRHQPFEGGKTSVEKAITQSVTLAL